MRRDTPNPKLFRLVAAVAAMATLAAPIRPAAAATKPPAPKAAAANQIQKLQDQVDEASTEESQLLGQIDDANAKRDTLNGQVHGLDGQIAGVQHDLDGAQSRLDQMEAALFDTQARFNQTEAQVAEAKRELEQRAVAAYIGSTPVDAAADLLLHVRSMHDLAASTGYVTAAMDEQKRSVQRYRQLKEQAQALRDKADQDRTEALAQRDVVAQKKGRLESERLVADSLRQQLGSVVAQANGLLAQVQAKKGEFEAQIIALQQQSDALASILRQRQNGQAIIVTGHGVLSIPIPGAPITSTFGPRVHPIFHDVRMHTGIDFGATAGTPIRSAADGDVVSAGPLGGYGNATVIDHGQSMATLYGHQSAIVVHVGDHVLRGQVIGYVGCTGFCTGPHLHFEVRINGTPVDPLPYL